MEFTRYTDLYNTDKDGKEILVKKGIVTKIDIPLEDIYRVEQVVSGTGKIYKTKCLIIVSQQQIPIIVNYSYAALRQKLNKLRSLSTAEIGFKYKNKNKQLKSKS